MSRRAKKIEKRVTLDPKYNSELVAHMIRVVIKFFRMVEHKFQYLIFFLKVNRRIGDQQHGNCARTHFTRNWRKSKINHSNCSYVYQRMLKEG